MKNGDKIKSVAFIILSSIVQRGSVLDVRGSE